MLSVESVLVIMLFRIYLTVDQASPLSMLQSLWYPDCVAIWPCSCPSYRSLRAGKTPFRLSAHCNSLADIECQR